MRKGKNAGKQSCLCRAKRRKRFVFALRVERKQGEKITITS